MLTHIGGVSVKPPGDQGFFTSLRHWCLDFQIGHAIALRSN